MTHQELKKLFTALSELDGNDSGQSSSVSELTALKWLSLHTQSSIQLRASHSRQLSELEFYQFISVHLEPQSAQDETRQKAPKDIPLFTPTLALEPSLFQKPSSSIQPSIEPMDHAQLLNPDQISAYEQSEVAENTPYQHIPQKTTVSGQDLASSTILSLNPQSKHKPKEMRMAQAVARLQELDPANNHAHFQQFTTWLKGHQAEHIKIVSISL